MTNDYKSVIDVITSLYDGKGSDEVMLNGIIGRTFFINHNVSILSIFKKDGLLWVRLSDKDRHPLDTRLERRLDDFTYFTLLDVKKYLENE